MNKMLFLVITIGMLMFSNLALADNEATYSADTGILNIPKIDVGGVYYNVNLQQQGQNLVFAVTGVSQSSSSSQDNVATYSAGVVHIPEVVVGGASYTVDMAQGEELNFSVTGATQIVSASTDQLVGNHELTLYGDNNISDGVSIESSAITLSTSTSNQVDYSAEIVGGQRFSMVKSGEDLLMLNPQPQYIDTWVAPNVFMLSDGSNGAFLIMGKDSGPLDISIRVATWAATEENVLSSQLAGQWQMKTIEDLNLRDRPLSPFPVSTMTLMISDLGNSQISVRFVENNISLTMNVIGNRLEPVVPVSNQVYFSMVTDGQAIAMASIGVESDDSTDISPQIGLAIPVR